MSTTDILREIEQLLFNEKLLIIEKALKDILRNINELQMTIAAEFLENEYRTNSELTAFSNLHS